MDWHRGAAAPLYDTSGVGDLLARLQAELGGGALLGTRLLYGPAEMLRAAREVEASCHRHPGSLLLVGFQTAARLQPQRHHYQALTAGGVTVVAYGTGTPDPPVPGVTWVELPHDPAALENQWFLVTRAPEPIALAGFECPPGAGMAVAHPGGRVPSRAFAGFVSDDPRLLGAVTHHLAAVAVARGVPFPQDGLP
jgi:hypothetical protein